MDTVDYGMGLCFMLYVFITCCICCISECLVVRKSKIIKFYDYWKTFHNCSWFLFLFDNDVGLWDAPSRRALPAAAGENKSSRPQSVVLVGNGVAIPSSGECPEPFSKRLLLGSVGAGVYSVHA